MPASVDVENITITTGTEDTLQDVPLEVPKLNDAIGAEDVKPMVPEDAGRAPENNVDAGVTTHAKPDAGTFSAVSSDVHTPASPHDTPIPTNGHPRPTSTPPAPAEPDTDPTELVIASLRTQVSDLFTQVKQLNSKLVSSYDRVSDLEDNVYTTSSALRASTLRITSLEAERTQHLSALNTGLLVEKSHVTAELNRLMEKATEEAAQRGQAESAKKDIEKELDDLSASLFDQANRMVAEARWKAAQSERRVGEAEEAMKGAEEAVKEMQGKMQEMEGRKEEAERTAGNLRVLMGKGKWAEGGSESAGVGEQVQRKLLSSHVPYEEFLLFVAHLRGLHAGAPGAHPAMSTLLPLPFLARIIIEDSEPTLRLDFAPSLNWLSRRSVLAAIHTGQLIIEPINTALLIQSTSNPPGNDSPYAQNVPGYNASTGTYACTMCGVAIVTVPPMGNGHSSGGAGGMGARAVGLLKSASSGSGSSPTQGRSSVEHAPVLDGTMPQQIYIFRLSPNTNTSNTSAPPTPAAVVSRTGSVYPAPPPSPHRGGSYTHGASSSAGPSLSPTSGGGSFTSSHTQPQAKLTVYPLCTSNWCLARLRTTCTLFAFIRTGIVEGVWEEEVSTLLPPPSHPAGGAPPVPKRSGSRGDVSALVNGVLSSVAGGVYPVYPSAHPVQPSLAWTSTSAASPPSTTSSSVPSRGGTPQPQEGEGAKPPVPPRRRTLWGMASALGLREKAASVMGGPAGSGSGSGGSGEGEEKKLPSPLDQEQETVRRSVPPLPPSIVSGSELHGGAGVPPPLPRRNEGRSRAGTPGVGVERQLGDVVVEDGKKGGDEDLGIVRKDEILFSVSDSVDGVDVQGKDEEKEMAKGEEKETVKCEGADSSKVEGTDSSKAEGETPSSVPLPASRPISQVVPQIELHPDPSLATLALDATPTPESTPAPAIDATSTSDATAALEAAPAPPPTIPGPPTPPAPPAIPQRRRERTMTISRPASPIRVPSRTGSPIPESPTTPSSPADAAISADAPGSTAPLAIPGASGLPAIPPRVPRRAAARAGVGAGRPLSSSGLREVAVAEEEEGEARGSGLKEVVSGEEEKVVEEEEKKAVEEKKEEEKSGKAAELPKAVVEAKAEEETKVVDSENDAPIAGSDDVKVATDESSLVPAPSSASPSPTDQAKSQPTIDVPEIQPIEEAKQTSSESEPAPLALSIPADERSASRPTEELTSPAQKDEPASEEHHEEHHEESSASSRAHEVFVGERTWEERTWKEVVRLREEMYWARVGGVR